MRIFFDTNVFVSALMGHGLCTELLERVIVDHRLVLGAPVREELAQILRGKFRVDKALCMGLFKKLDALEQAPPAAPTARWGVADPDDVPVIACAVATGAEYFVTGDKALLKLGELEGMSLVPPRGLWELLLVNE